MSARIFAFQFLLISYNSNKYSELIALEHIQILRIVSFIEL